MGQIRGSKWAKTDCQNQPLRVLFTKAGTLPAATLLRDISAVVDHKLYWAPVDHETEGYYLISILNSETARARVQARQSRGQWGARDFDKVMFELPIPRFDAAQTLHRELAEIGRAAEEAAAAVALPENMRFTAARRTARTTLAEAGIAQRIDVLVAALFDSPSEQR